MKIIKSTETIHVEHPVFCLFGQPGICKSSLGYSSKKPLILDFDKGAHRASNRGDTALIDTWADVEDLKEALKDYDTAVVDTVGRCLDVMTVDIIEKTPKYGRDGALTLQGYGVLKSRFRTWIAQLRAMGKDVVLIAHQKEDKDGDTVIVRPEITGSSYDEVMKISDFVGFIYMQGRDRMIDFNPTDRWVGKNPGNWKAAKVPPAKEAQTFLADLIEQGRAALGKISEASAVVASQVDDWRAQIQTYTTADDFNKAIPDIKKLPTVLQAQISKLLLDGAKAKSVTFDTKAKVFVVPQVEPEHAGSLL